MRRRLHAQQPAMPATMGSGINPRVSGDRRGDGRLFTLHKAAMQRAPTSRKSGSDGDEPLLRKYAAELVGTSPDVLMTELTAALAAVRRETKSIPTIFVNVSDPVGQGFVASLAHPGGNTTGIYSFRIFDGHQMGRDSVRLPLSTLDSSSTAWGMRTRLCFFKQYGLLRKISKSM